MGLEWLMPTAVVIYISKPYFDAFLREAGKDHYSLLRSALGKLGAKFTGRDAPRNHLVFAGTRKCESPTPRYSMLYSIIADLPNGVAAKLLLQPRFGADTCNAAQAAFLGFLEGVHDGTLDPASVDGLASARPVSNLLLLAYAPDAKRLHVLDPLARHQPPST